MWGSGLGVRDGRDADVGMQTGPGERSPRKAPGTPWSRSYKSSDGRVCDIGVRTAGRCFAELQWPARSRVWYVAVRLLIHIRGSHGAPGKARWASIGGTRLSEVDRSSDSGACRLLGRHTSKGLVAHTRLVRGTTVNRTKY